MRGGINAEVVCLCDSSKNLYIFHNEGKKAPDGKDDLVTFTYSHTGDDLSSITCRLLCACVRVCVCCFIDLFIAPKETSAAFHLLLQFPHRAHERTDEVKHADMLAASLWCFDEECEVLPLYSPGKIPL